MAVRFGTRTAWIVDVLDDVKKTIVASNQFSADLVYPYINDPNEQFDEPTGGKYCSIYPGNIVTANGPTHGGPDSWVMCEGTFNVDVFSRVLKDARGRSAAELADGTRGFGTLTQAVAKVLHRATLANTDGDSYLHEPIRVLGINFNRKKSAVGWGSATISLSAKWRATFS